MDLRLQILGLTQRAAQQTGAASPVPQEEEGVPPPPTPGSPPPDQNMSPQERPQPRSYIAPGPGPPPGGPPPSDLSAPPPSPPNLNMLRVGGPGQPGGSAAGQAGQRTAGQHPNHAFATWWPWPSPQLRGAIEEVRGVPCLFTRHEASGCLFELWRWRACCCQCDLLVSWVVLVVESIILTLWR